MKILRETQFVVRQRLIPDQCQPVFSSSLTRSVRSYTDVMTDRVLTADVVQQIAALASLDLTTGRAADLLPSLLPIFQGDARIAAMNLGTLSPLGTPWPKTPDE